MSFATILDHIGKRPGMYFGGCGENRRLELVQAFVMGYEAALQVQDSSLPFTHFTRWVAAHYRVRDGAMGGFALIRERMGGDERLAFDEFFRLVPLYSHDMAVIGPDGIHRHYGEVMAQIPSSL